MSQQKKEAVEALMGFINRRAIELLELPPQDRPQRLAVIRESSIASAKHTMSLDDARAREWADKVNGFILDAVSLVESSGGGQATKPQ
jgi:hypothetical protein